MSYFHLFPYSMIHYGSKIVIYGAGMVAKDYMRQLNETDYCTVSCVVAKNYKEIDYKRYFNYHFVSPDELKTRKDYDYVVLATKEKRYADEMTEFLLSCDVEMSKIVSTVIPIQTIEVTYSQHGEDRIIYEAFKHMGFFKNGLMPSYIDVGAHHPYEISNTALFYQIGCHGINVEANPRLIELFNEERPGDINLCVGVGAEEGTFPFYITKYDGLNTFKKENISYNEFLSEQNTGIRESFEIIDVVDIKVKRLQDIILEYANGKWPEYMSIDIEGMEFEVLENTDFGNNGPLLIVVEVNYEGDLFIELMKTKGYFPYIWYRENIIFIRNDMEKLVHAHTERE